MFDQMNYVPLDEAVELVKSLHRLDWIGNFDLKYIQIHIDTRDKKCILLNKNGKCFTQEQYDAFKNGDRFKYVEWVEKKKKKSKK
jgi:hypothetical protein